MSDMLTALQAKLEIKELTAEYCRHATASDGAGLAALFVEDGFLDSSGLIVSGKPALEAYIDRLPARTVVPLIHNHIISVEGDRATGHCVVFSPCGPPELGQFVAQYADAYRHEGGCWRFVSRTIEILYSAVRAG